MPFKSQAQRRKFAQLLVEGKISPDTYEEWNRETGGATLPERASRKAPVKKRAAGTARRKATGTKRTGTKAARTKAKTRKPRKKTRTGTTRR